MPESVKTRSSSGPTNGAMVRAVSSARFFSVLPATPQRIFGLAIALLLAALALAPVASGAPSPVASGEAKLVLSPGLYRLLQENDVRMTRRV